MQRPQVELPAHIDQARHVARDSGDEVGLFYNEGCGQPVRNAQYDLAIDVLAGKILIANALPDLDASKGKKCFERQGPAHNRMILAYDASHLVVE